MLVISCLLLISCGSSKLVPAKELTIRESERGPSYGPLPPNTKPGKCYQKVTHNEFLVWSEVLCETEITKELINEIHENLIRLSYSVDQNEVSYGKLGASTKAALRAFQLDNDMAYGGLDWNTIKRLKQE